MDTSKWEQAQSGCLPGRYPEAFILFLLVAPLGPKRSPRHREASADAQDGSLSSGTSQGCVCRIPGLHFSSGDHTPLTSDRTSPRFSTTSSTTLLAVYGPKLFSFRFIAPFFYALVSFVKQLCRKREQVCFYISDGFNLFKPVDILVTLNPTFVFEDVFEACFYNKCFCIHLFFPEVIRRIMYRAFTCPIF